MKHNMHAGLIKHSTFLQVETAVSYLQLLTHALRLTLLLAIKPTSTALAIPMAPLLFPQPVVRVHTIIHGHLATYLVEHNPILQQEPTPLILQMPTTVLARLL